MTPDNVLLDALRHTGQHATAALLEQADRTREAAETSADEESATS